MIKPIFNYIIFVIALIFIALVIGHRYGYLQAKKIFENPAIITRRIPEEKKTAFQPRKFVPRSTTKPTTLNPLKNTTKPEDDNFVQPPIELTWQSLQKIDLTTITKEQLNNNLLMTEMLIQQEPNFYEAYKMKLKLLLIKELKFKEAVDLDDYEDLYEEMISFEGPGIYDELIDVTFFTMGDTTTLSGIDRDLLHIPFIRLSALNDTEGLRMMAEDFIDEFPDSYIGYLYLAEAAWKQGEKEEAANIVGFIFKQPDRAQMIPHLFSYFQDQPLNRILRMQ